MDQRTARKATAGPTAQSWPTQTWEAAVGRGEACLRASSRRYRVVAQNTARAALSALRRHGISTADANEANVHIAVYASERAHDEPVAVFAVGGTPQAPELCLRFARMGMGGRIALDDEAAAASGPRALRRAARVRAEMALGQSGLREVLTDRFWEREISLYTGTALVLAAFGFPMSPGVFVVGGILLAMQGAARLSWHELRLILKGRRIARDPALKAELQEFAARMAFARRYRLDPVTALRGDSQTVVRGELTVPDLHGDNALRLLVDENVVATVGGISPGMLVGGHEAQVSPGLDDSLPDSDNVLTVVFRRLRRPRRGAEEQAAEAADAADDGRPDLDDIGREPLRPSKVDVEDMGSFRRLGGRVVPMLPGSGDDGEAEDIEVIDAEVIEAEVIDPDEDDSDSPPTLPRGPRRRS